MSDTITPGSGAVIESEGGVVDVTAFAEAVGESLLHTPDEVAPEFLEGEDETSSEPEQEESTEEEVDEDESQDEVEDDSDSETDETEEEDEEESSEVSEEVESDKSEKTPTRTFKARDENGKEIEVSGDLVVFNKVDGEWQEIRIQDAIDREVGELTVEQRISKVSNQKHELEQKEAQFEQERKTYQAEIQAERDVVQQVIDAAQKDPGKALAILGAHNGISPGQMMKQFIDSARQYMLALEDKNPGDIATYINQLDAQWYKSQLEQKNKASESAREKEQRHERLAESLRENDIDPETFQDAVNRFSNEVDNSQGLESATNQIIELVLEERHESAVLEAIKEVDPSRAEDEKLLDAVLSVTDLKEDGADGILKVVRGVIGDEKTRRAVNLSRKAQGKAGPSSKRGRTDKRKKQKVKTYTSSLDMMEDLMSD